MRIEIVWVRNFRRLKDARIELASDTSTFVGTNTSSKASVAHALQIFTSAMKSKFTLHDLSSSAGMPSTLSERADGVEPPSICLGFWFCITLADLHRAVDLLLSLE